MLAAGASLLALAVALDPSAARVQAEIGVATEARARSLDQDGQPVRLGRELQVTPDLRLALSNRVASAAVGYAPRVLLSDPGDGTGQALRVVHEGRAQLDSHLGRTATLTAKGSAAYGSEPRVGTSVDLAAPGSTVSAGPAEAITYLRWEAGADVQARPWKRWRLDAGAGWRASAGLGSSAAALPREEGPRARVAAGWDATRRDVVGGVLDASASRIGGVLDVAIGSASGTWRHGLSRHASAELALGAGAARAGDEATQVRPVGRAALAVAWPRATGGADASLALDSFLSVNRFTGEVRERHELRAGLGWSAHRGWRVDGRAIGAVETDGTELRDRVGALEIRGALRLGVTTTFVAGARAGFQRSATAGLASFVDWSGFAGVSVHGTSGAGI